MRTSYKNNWEVKLMLDQNQRRNISIFDKNFAMSFKLCVPIIFMLVEWKNLLAKFSISITKNFSVIDSIQGMDAMTFI